MRLKLLILSLIMILTSNMIKGQSDSTYNNLVLNSSGIELRIEGPYSEEMSYGSYMSPIFLTYRNERRLFKYVTLIMNGGIIFIQKSLNFDYYGQLLYKPLIGNELNHFNLGINFSIEPRWYFNSHKKVSTNRVKPLSSFYLSFPLESSLPIDLSINQIDENYDFNNFTKVNWLSDYYRINYNFGPAIGYKHAFTNHFHVDAMIHFSAKNYYINSLNYILSERMNINPQFKLRVAYDFN